VREANTVHDISQSSFDEFVAFLFERDIPPEKSRPWYWDAQVIFDLDRACEYYVRMFREPVFLIERFSKGQLEQGFWAIKAALLDVSR
jgi:hypothetical protein